MDIETKIWVVFIIIGSLPVMVPVFYLLPKLVRSYRIEKIAREFNLEYKRKGEQFAFSVSSERNILMGVVNNHNIEAYDRYKWVRSPWWLWLLGPMRGGGTTRRSTIVKIDGIEKEMRGFLSGFAPIYRLRQILMDLDNRS